MKLHFIKMHGAGNDYIYINCLGGAPEPKDPQKLARLLSQRHFSVGADGLVLICPSKTAHAKMKMFNVDGSEGAVCGNALRCVGKLLFENGFARKSHLKIETQSGVRDLFLTVMNGEVGLVTVDMGKAEAGELFMLECRGEKYLLRAINIGNEHQVTFTSDVDMLSLEDIGRVFEKNPRYADGVNTEFCEVVEKNHLKVRTFERGSGETLACGSGACAAAAAGILSGACEPNKPTRISMRGGDLFVLCDEELRVYLTGGAKISFEGYADVEI